MTNKIITWTFLIVTFVVAVFTFPSLPASIACQWDAAGNVTNEISKWGIFMPTVIINFLVLRNKFLPGKDIMSSKISNYLFLFVMVLLLFFQLYMVLFNTGMKILLIPKYFNIIFGLLLILVGNLLPKIPQNFLVGIKTVWGYQNDDIWTKTQRLSSKLWVIVGLIMIISIFLPWKIQGVLTLLFLLLLTFVPNIYGMVLHGRLDGNAHEN